MTTFAVSTAQELAKALDSASGGDRIVLNAGDYGDLSIQYKDFSSEVTITSADPSNRAEFNTIKMYETSNIVFDNIAVDFQPDVTTVEFDSGVTIKNSEHITFQNSSLSGGDAVGGIPVDSDPSEYDGIRGIDGFPIGRAVTAHYVDDLTFHNNEISEFKTGISLAHIDGLTVTNNLMSGLRTTMVSGGNVSNAELSDNHFTDLTPWRSNGDGDHGDFVHFWTITGQDGPSVNHVYKNNYFEQGDAGGSVLGIYIEDNGKGIGYENILIENNIIHNGDSQGLTIENTDGLIIRDNTLLQSSGGVNDAPGILLLYETRNAVVDNNITGGIWGSAYVKADVLNIDFKDTNLIVQRFVPNDANYVGNLFVNPLVQSGNLGDLTVVPGSLADGVGAAMTQLTGSENFLAISAEAHVGLDMMRVDLSALLLAGSLDLEGASVAWNFGDGKTAAGAQVAHTFDKAGQYQVNAVVTLANGQKQTLHKVVEIATPIALQASFEGGIKDTTDLINTVGVQKDVALVQTELGRSLDLKSASSNVRFDISGELQDNPEYTLSFSFHYDESSQDGHAIYFPGAAIINLQGGEVWLTGTTDLAEKISIESKGAQVNDGNWHQLTYVFSQAAGTASLFLDDAMVGQVVGLEGSQGFSHYHGLNVGSPFGSSFTGQIDNLQFLRGALSDDEVRSGVDTLYQADVVEDIVVAEAVVSVVAAAAVAPPPVAVETEAVVSVVTTTAVTPPSVAVETPDVSVVTAAAVTPPSVAVNTPDVNVSAVNNLADDDKVVAVSSVQTWNTNRSNDVGSTTPLQKPARASSDQGSSADDATEESNANSVESEVGSFLKALFASLRERSRDEYQNTDQFIDVQPLSFPMQQEYSHGEEYSLREAELNSSFDQETVLMAAADLYDWA